MVIRLHKNARTTPAVRRELQTAEGSNKVLAKRYNVTPPTIAKWRAREDVRDVLALRAPTPDHADTGAGGGGGATASHRPAAPR